MQPNIRAWKTTSACGRISLGLVCGALALVGPGPARAQAGKTGGYAAAAVTNQEVVAAAQFAIAAEAKSLRQDAPAARLELVSIRQAEQQVVAGMNYRLRLKVRHNGAEKEAEAVVWWQAWNQGEPYRLTSWDWK